MACPSELPAQRLSPSTVPLSRRDRRAGQHYGADLGVRFSAPDRPAEAVTEEAVAIPPGSWPLPARPLPPDLAWALSNLGFMFCATSGYGHEGQGGRHFSTVAQRPPAVTS